MPKKVNVSDEVQTKEINCMRDHTLMQHSNIYKHTNKSKHRTAQKKHITKHRTATLAVLSVVTCF